MAKQEANGLVDQPSVISSNGYRDTATRRLFTRAIIKVYQRLNRYHRVLLIPGGLCIKSGRDVHLTEAEHILLVGTKTSVPVPKIYWAFKRGPVTYIVMSRAKGNSLYSTWHARSASSKAAILATLKSHVEQFRQLPPPAVGYVGAVPGSKVYDMRYPALRDGAEPFESVQHFHRTLRNGIDVFEDNDAEVKNRLNQMVASQNAQPNSSKFSHGDLSSRNIMVDGDQITAIIDWETSGWYPDYWEYARARLDYNLRDEFWSHEVDNFLAPYHDQIEMDQTRCRYFGDF